MRKESDNTPLSSRLSLMGDEMRQSWWDRRSEQDSIEFWRIPMPTRWHLLPESEKKKRSICCCAPYGQYGNEPIRCTGRIPLDGRPGEFRDCNKEYGRKPGRLSVPDELPIPSHGRERMDVMAGNAYQPEPKEYEIGADE